MNKPNVIYKGKKTMELISSVAEITVVMAGCRQSIVLVLALLAVLLTEASCWVFNDVQYRGLVRALQEGGEELESDDLAMQRISLIFPGTKWCGPGNIAENYDDLGVLEATDKCCRAHDSCPDLIEAGETKYNLTNKAFYSRLNCKCDVEFHDCLKKDSGKSSNIIGNLYFNGIGTKCYRKDYPVIGCKRKGGWYDSKCLEYDYNTKGKKIYQWFDEPPY